MREGQDSIFTALQTLLEPILSRLMEEKIQKALAMKKLPEKAAPYLTVKEAADMSRLGSSTIRLAIRKRELKAHKVGSRVIIKRADLESYLEAHPIEARSD